MTDRPLTLTQAAAALGLSRSAVFDLIQRKVLPATQRRVPGQTLPMWFVLPADVEAYRARRGERLGMRGRPPKQEEGSA